MTENVYIYHKKETDENVNMKQKAKLIILKVILKWLNLKIIKEVKNKEADINLKRGLNPYQYNVIDNFC